MVKCYYGRLWKTIWWCVPYRALIKKFTSLAFLTLWQLNFQKGYSLFGPFVDIRPNSNQINTKMGGTIINLWKIYPKTQPKGAKTGP